MRRVLGRPAPEPSGSRGRARLTEAQDTLERDRELEPQLIQLTDVAGSADFDEFGDLLRLALRLRGVRRSGASLAAVSNAGFEAVGMADALRVDGAALSLARFAPATTARLEAALAAHRLDGLVDAKNPLDVTPMASDAAFCELAGSILADPGVDVLVASFVPLTPAMQTLPGPAGGPGIDHPDSIAQRLPAVARAAGKPIVAVVAAGSLFDPLVARLEAGGLPVFRSADRAVRALVRYLATPRRK